MTFVSLLQCAWLRRCWLDAEPAPGVISGWSQPAWTAETILPLDPLPTWPSAEVVSRRALDQALEQLLRDEFWTVLFAYPGARVVYPLFAMALLALCVGHAVELRRRRLVAR